MLLNMDLVELDYFIKESMDKNQLIKRWKTEEGKLLLESVKRALEKGNSLEDLKKIEKYNGRWDLRGAELSTLKKETRIESSGHSFSQKEGSLKLKKAKLENIDFSYCNVKYSLIERCFVSNCIFKETKAQELYIIASDFINCCFEKSDISHSFLNENIGKNSGSFKNTEFIETNLKECSFSFPIVEQCSFENCNLYATNFNGSRFFDTKFKGVIDSPWFSGYATNINKSILGIFNSISPKNYPNKMINVDFSEAKLIGVSFINGVDLNNCKFPNNENYILIKDIKKTFSKAREVINNEWPTDYKRIANNLIDNLYLATNKQNQSMDLVDQYLLTDDGKMKEFGEKLFNLIKSLR